MSVEKVLIDFQSQIDGINKAITALEKLQKTDKGLHDQFVKNSSDNKKSVESVNTSLNSVNNTLRNIAGSVGLAFGVQAIVNYGKEAVSLKAKMESLQNTFNFAFGSAKEGANAMEFVRVLSNKLGLELVSTADAFKKFSAAANLSGIAANDTKKIFAQVSTAVTAMGLSAEDANGVFLALSQIISKGTVQAEELRGQIGERVPGAFNLAAKAMGVTTKELNKMLEQGQVLSVDFLPKFAQEMEDTFGKAVPAAAESTQAKLNRLSNTFTDLKNSIGALIADSGIIDFFSRLSEEIRIASTPVDQLISESALSNAQDFVKQLSEGAEKTGKNFEEIAREAIVVTSAQVQLQKQKQQQLSDEFALSGEFTEFQRAAFLKEFNEQELLIKQGEKSIELLKQEVESRGKVVAATKELTKEQKAAIEKAKKEEISAREDLEQLKIKNINNERERLIAQADYEIKNLKGSKKTQAELTIEIQKRLNVDLAKLYVEDREHQEEEHEKAIKSYEKKIEDERKVREDFLKETRQQMQDDAKKEEDDEEKKRQEFEQIQAAKFDLATEAFNGLAEIANSYRDHEIEVAKELLDAKIISEEEYNKRVKKIKREQAIIDKAQALFNIAIHTAENVVKVFPNAILQALAIALGVVQAGVVLAKPIPFNKGTKRVPGVDMGVDSVHAILRPGEKVFTTERSREYGPILDAIFDAKLPAVFLNKVAKGEKVDGFALDEYAIKRGFEGALRNGIRVKNFPEQQGISMAELEYMKARGII